MVKKSKGRNAKGLRGADLRDIEKPCTSNETKCYSLLGELVEVRQRGAGFRGSWHPAKVVKIDSNQSLVEYEKLLSKDGSPRFQEYVPLSEDDSRILLRPRPPPFVYPEGWQRGLWVDAFYGDAWWEGVLMDDVSESMQVFFPDEGDRRSFCTANLRVSQEWDNKTGTWTIKGKWTEFSSIEGRKFRLKRTFAVQPKQTVPEEALEVNAGEPETPAGEVQKAEDDPCEACEEGKRKRSDGEEEADSDDENLFHWLERRKKQRLMDDAGALAMVEEDGGLARMLETCGGVSDSAPEAGRVSDDLIDETPGAAAVVFDDQIDETPGAAGGAFDDQTPGAAGGAFDDQTPGAVGGGSEDRIDETPEADRIDETPEADRIDETPEADRIDETPEADWIDETPEADRIDETSGAAEGFSLVDEETLVFMQLDDQTSVPAPRCVTSFEDEDSAPGEETRERSLTSLEQVGKSSEAESSAAMEETGGGSLTGLDDEKLALGLSTPLKEPSPEAKSNLTNDAPEPGDAETESTPKAQFQSMEKFSEEPGAPPCEQIPVQGIPVSSFEEAILGEATTPTPSVEKLKASTSRSLKLVKKTSKGNGESSSARSALAAAVNKTKKLLLDAGWVIKQSLRERFSRSSQEIFCVSPEGKPYVSLASACREWMRRNKHRKLAYLQLVARGESSGPCELLDHTPGARRGREETGAEEYHKSKKLKMKGDQPEKKRGRPRGDCRLEASARSRQEEDEEARLSKKLTLFSWLIDMGILSEGLELQGRRGVISSEGIVCGCCRRTFSASAFEAHARSGGEGLDSALRLGDGRSILECKLAGLRAMKAKESEVLAENQAIEVDENDDTCAVCGHGGQLVCCDHCPSTYHLRCVQLEKVPEGDWFCPRCCCASCGSNLYNPEKQADILYCDQCEREYHASCLQGEGMKYNSGENRFCSRKCCKIFRGLRRLVGKQNAMAGGFTWTLLRLELQSDAQDLEAIAENSTRLALALTLIQECFRPMIDPRTKTDIVTHILFNQRADEKRLDFRGFYTLVLERDGEMISVASLRIHGAHAAEIPFIGTRAQYRRQGMCRRLINVTEQILQALEVQTLVLPAIAEFAETWTNAFGFQKLTPAQGVQLMELSIVTFPGTSILHKPLTWLHCGRKPPPSEEKLYLSLLQDEESGDDDKPVEKLASPVPDEAPEVKKKSSRPVKKMKGSSGDESPPEAPLSGEEQIVSPKPRAAIAKARSNNRVVKSPTWKSRYLKLLDEQQQTPVAEAPKRPRIKIKVTPPPPPPAEAPKKKPSIKVAPVEAPRRKAGGASPVEAPRKKHVEAPKKKPSIETLTPRKKLMSINVVGSDTDHSDEPPEPVSSPTPRTFSRRRPKASTIAGPLGSSQADYLGIPKWPTSKRSKRARPLMKSHSAVASRRVSKKLVRRI